MPDLHLEDADGNVLHSSTRGGTRNERIEATLEAGTYYVRVVAQEEGENAYTLRYRAEEPEAPAPPEPDPLPEPEETKPQLQPNPSPVVLTSVPEPAGQDFSADTSTKGRILVDGSVTGNNDRWRDVDWFAVELEAGTTYRIDLNGWPLVRDGGWLRDPELRGIYDAEGILIGGTSDDNSGRNRNSRTIFTPDEDGTYYVAATGTWYSWFATNSPGGKYKLTVADATDDFTADTDTTGRIAVGAAATGDIERPGDRDWFAVELEAGKTYWFDMKGLTLNPREGTLPVARLHGIHDADGNRIVGTAHETIDSFNSRMRFTATEDGTHYVAAGAGPSPWPIFPVDTVGTYTLTAEEIVDTI